MLFTVSKITTLDEMLELSCAETSSWVGELEWPKEVVDLFEIGSNSVDFMDNVFYTDNAILAEILFDDGVVSQWNALLINLSITTFVDELTN